MVADASACTPPRARAPEHAAPPPHHAVSCRFIPHDTPRIVSHRIASYRIALRIFAYRVCGTIRVIVQARSSRPTCCGPPFSSVPGSRRAHTPCSSHGIRSDVIRSDKKAIVQLRSPSRRAHSPPCKRQSSLPSASQIILAFLFSIRMQYTYAVCLLTIRIVHKILYILLRMQYTW